MCNYVCVGVCHQLLSRSSDGAGGEPEHHGIHQTATVLLRSVHGRTGGHLLEGGMCVAWGRAQRAVG